MKILAVSISGIGNTILFTPALKNLRAHFPQARMDVLTWSRAMAAPVEGSNLADRILVVPSRAAQVPGFLAALRRERYDLSIVAFPSNKAAFHLLSFMAGARVRISHRYPGFGLRTCSFLEMKTIAADETIHDVEQNLRLLPLAGARPDAAEPALVFHVSPEDEAWAGQWIQARGLEGRVLVGLHPGAGSALADWQGSIKRWPADRFRDVARRFIDERGAAVLLLGGPDEADLKNTLERSIERPGSVYTVEGSLKGTAALIGRCDIMISNDSGLMHTAVARGTPTVGIFGPTNASRTRPWGPAAVAITPSPPCSRPMGYPFHSTNSRLDRRAHSCLARIPADRVFSTAAELLDRTSPRRTRA